jgi:hypothetical protein
MGNIPVASRPMLDAKTCRFQKRLAFLPGKQELISESEYLSS